MKFLNQTRASALKAMTPAGRYPLGWRDSLVIANYLLAGIPVLYSHDRELVSLQKASLGGRELSIQDPAI